MIAFFVKILIRKQQARSGSWDVLFYWIQPGCDIIPNVYNLEQEITNQGLPAEQKIRQKVKNAELGPE